MSLQSQVRFEAGGLQARLLSALLDALDEGIDGLPLDAFIDIPRVRQCKTEAAWSRRGDQLRRVRLDWQGKRGGWSGNSRPPRTTPDDWIRAAIHSRVGNELRGRARCFLQGNDGRWKLTEQARMLVAPIARDRLVAVEQCQQAHIDCGYHPAWEIVRVPLPPAHPCKQCGVSLVSGLTKFCDNCQAAKRRAATTLWRHSPGGMASRAAYYLRLKEKKEGQSDTPARGRR